MEITAPKRLAAPSPLRFEAPRFSQPVGGAHTNNEKIRIELK